MAHAQKPEFVFLRNGRVHLNWRGRHFSRLLAAEVCASAVVMLDTTCSEVVWRVLAIHSIRQFPRHFPSRASPCAITFQLEFNTVNEQVILLQWLGICCMNLTHRLCQEVQYNMPWCCVGQQHKPVARHKHCYGVRRISGVTMFLAPGVSTQNGGHWQKLWLLRKI